MSYHYRYIFVALKTATFSWHSSERFVFVYFRLFFPSRVSYLYTSRDGCLPSPCSAPTPPSSRP